MPAEAALGHHGSDGHVKCQRVDIFLFSVMITALSLIDTEIKEDAMNTTILHDDHGNPIFAVLPYETYTKLLNQQKPRNGERISQTKDTRRYIELPHGGGARLDVAQLIAYFHTYGMTTMGVVSRAQSYDKFEQSELNHLDPVIRRVFLSANSPYKNTMQAVTTVVDALVATGVFRKAKVDLGYYRPVKAITIDLQRSTEFLEACGNPEFDFPEDAYVRQDVSK